MYRTQRWLADQTPDAIATTIGGYFPDLDRGILTRSLARYKSQGVWSTEPILSEAGYNCLRRAILGCGFLQREVPFAECVNNTLAEEVVAAI